MASAYVRSTARTDWQGRTDYTRIPPLLPLRAFCLQFLQKVVEMIDQSESVY